MKRQKVDIPDTLYERIRLCASRLEMTISALIRQAISEFLERHGG
jgi:predicted transcriptional regulator